MRPTLSAAIAWSGLPAYGLNAIKALVVRLAAPPIVPGTLPDTSYDAIDSLAILALYRINKQDDFVRWSQFAAHVPDVFVVSGLVTPSFNRLGRQLIYNGSSVIAVVDNRCRGNLRQIVAPAVFRTKYLN